jgi:hypothetical protein
MKIGIMQPYFMPYMAYWQLINAVDKYVIYDDVNYINRGWIGRNRILVEGEPKYINISMLNASQNKKINEIQVHNESKTLAKKLRTIEYAYKKAPYYERISPLIERILKYMNLNLAQYIENSINIICDYLEIKTELIISSSLKKNNNLKGQEKILDICKLLDATEYYNAIGGRELYSYVDFMSNGIELKFLKMNDIIYKQFNNEFQRNLSIIDVLMFNSKEKVCEMLQQYTVIVGSEKVLEL